MNPQPGFSADVATVLFLVMFFIFLCNKKNHYKFSDKLVIASYDDDSTNISVTTPSVTPKAPQLHVPPVPAKPAAKPVAKPAAKPAHKKAKRSPARNSNPQPKTNRNHNGYTPLQQDCFDALKSLGIKAVKERKFIVSNTFNKHDPKTIQDFLKVALHRGI